MMYGHILTMLIICVLLSISSVSAAVALPNTHVMFLYSSIGGYANYTDLKFLAPYWQTHIKSMIQQHPTWPFDVSIEIYDIQSNCTLIKSIMETRILDKSKPPITVIVAEGDDCPDQNLMGCGSAQIAGQFGIPILLTGFNPDLAGEFYTFPPQQNTSLSMIGPTYRTLRQTVDTYIEVGVKTVVSVANVRYDYYNRHTCNGAASVMAARGVKVSGTFTILDTDNGDVVTTIIQQIKNLNPDAVLWCDWGACALSDQIAEFLPMQKFKDANYLPKALNLLDCLDSPYVPDLSLFQYVTGANFVNPKITGFQYTEDATVYSSMFRPVTSPTFNGFDQMNLGVTTDLPSSTQLFFSWFYNLKGYNPSYATTFSWAALDILEKSLYLAWSNPIIKAQGYITPIELYGMMKGMGCLTPVGAVMFDANGINTISPVILAQSLPSSSTAEIIGPSSVATAKFVYPMPTWADRIYTWTLIGTTEEKSAIAIAAACSFILLTIIITCIVNRKDGEIKMVHYLHVTVYCLCAICVCWSSALLWQADNIQAQCNGYLW